MSHLFGFLVFIIILILAAGFFKTWQVQNDPQEKEFLSGSMPQNPNGLFHGSIGSWRGKSFDASSSAGINNFEEGGKIVQKYPFKSYAGMGLQDKNLAVLKIDYNIDANPFWLRTVMDEVVSTGDGKLLGKINVRIFPGLSFAIGYFNLAQ